MSRFHYHVSEVQCAYIKALKDVHELYGYSNLKGTSPTRITEEWCKQQATLGYCGINCNTAEYNVGAITLTKS